MSIKRVGINVALVLFVCIAATLIVLTFVAETEFNEANDLDNNYRWEKAEDKYRLAIKLNPFCSEYVLKYGEFLEKQAVYNKNKETYFMKAKNLYKKACYLNPIDAKSYYLLGAIYLKLNDKDNAIEYFVKSLKRDPYNPEINYLVGYNLLTIWHSINGKEKELVLNSLRHTLCLEPEYAQHIYSLIVKYTREFEIAEKVTPATLEAYQNLYYFMSSNDLWQFRKKIVEKINFYYKKEEPEKFEEEKRKKEELLTNLSYRASNGDLEDWTGKSDQGENEYTNGYMYWAGTVCKVIKLPKGNTIVKIEAKGSSAGNIYPYMIVEVDGKEIGELFVDSLEWKEYSFKVDSEGGMKILNVTFVNDGGDVKKGEDRNLYLKGVIVISIDDN